MPPQNQDQNQDQNKHVEGQEVLGDSGNPEIKQQIDEARERADSEKERLADNQLTSAETKIDASSLSMEAKETARYKNELITYEIIQGTQLETTMLTVLSNPKFEQYSDLKGKTEKEKIEIIFSKINRVITKFLERKIMVDSKEPIPEHISKVITPAVEWHLMEMLKEGGHETNVNFLSEVLGGSSGKGILDVDNVKSLGNEMMNIFNKYGTQYKSGKALLNVIDFLSLPKNQEQTKKLKNPYELYEKVFKNPIFQNTFKAEGENSTGIVNINTITWEQFGLSDLSAQLTEEELNQKLEEGKRIMKEELGSIQMVNSPETVEKILGVLNKADSFLSSTKKMGDELIDNIDSLGGTAQALNHTFGVDAWKMLKNLEKYPVIGGIITFVLSLLGFTGGVDGVEKAWKKRKLDRELTDEKKEYITEVFDYYMKNKTVDDNKMQDFLKAYKINIDAKYKEKFAIDLPLIEEQIAKKIEENGELLNPTTLASINTNNFKGKDMVQEVKEGNKKVLKLKKTTFTDTERAEFIKGYIQSILAYYGKPKNTEKLKDADSLAFSMIAGVTLNKDDVVDGVEAEVFLPSQFYNTPTAPTAPEDNTETPTIKYGENLTYAEELPEKKKNIIKTELEAVHSPLTAENIINVCKTEKIPIEYMMAIIKERSSYASISGSEEKKNPGKILEIATTTEKKFTTREEGLTALAKEISSRVNGYKNIYGADKYPWISYLLENKGPDGKGFLSGESNYKQNNDYQGETPPKGAFITKRDETGKIENQVTVLKGKFDEA